MSLADAIGLVFVLFFALVVLVALVIEAIWRLRQRNEYLKRTTTGRPAPAVSAPNKAEHLVLALPYTGFNFDVAYPRDAKTQETFKDFLDEQFNLHRWEFVGFVADEAIVFRREKTS